MVLVEDIWDKARGEFGIGGDCDEDEVLPRSAPPISFNSLTSHRSSSAPITCPTVQEHCGGSGMTVWKEDEVLQLVQDSCGSEKNWWVSTTKDTWYCGASRILGYVILLCPWQGAALHAGLRAG
jgi:hypothetical protein